jgi:hypothetical protein
MTTNNDFDLEEFQAEVLKNIETYLARESLLADLSKVSLMRSKVLSLIEQFDSDTSLLILKSSPELLSQTISKLENEILEIKKARMHSPKSQQHHTPKPLQPSKRTDSRRKPRTN